MTVLATSPLETEDSLLISVQGNSWMLPQNDATDLNLMLQTNRGLSPLLASLLVQKKIGPQNVSTYLKPKLKNALGDPFSLLGMDQGVSRLKSAIHNGETIGIIGDYDVDGAASTAVLKKGLEALGAKICFHIPDRLKEGYGPSELGIDSLKDEGATLILTVDCGIASHAPLQYASENKIDVIVIDHHLQGNTLPRAHTIINPNQEKDMSGLNHLCAAGVSFLVIYALYKKTPGATEHLNLMSLLDLVALATVCDVVPLHGLNRAFVSQGLKVMAKTDHLGLKMLVEALNIIPPITVYDIGFILGPHINAGGRIGASTLGTLLFTSKTPEACEKIIQEMMALNQERKQIETEMTAHALQKAEEQSDRSVICIAEKSWHPGIIGIVASRVKDKTKKPAIIIGIDDTGTGKGSGRSVKGLNLGVLIQKAKDESLLLAGGGHAMAAGLTISEDCIEAFQDFIQQHAQVNSENPLKMLGGTLSLSAITTEIIDAIDKMGPYGTGNPQPFFMVPHVQFRNVIVRGEKHISFRLWGETHKGQLNGIAFNVVGTPVGDAISLQHKTYHVVGRLQKDIWQGRTQIKLHLEDIIPVTTSLPGPGF